MRSRFVLPLTTLAAACEPQNATCPNGVLVVTTNETDATQVGVLPLDGTPAAMNTGSVLGKDPQLATSAGRHFLIDRSPGVDLFYELDSCGHGVSQTSTRGFDETDWTDPQDVAVAPDGVFWVARLLSPKIFVERPVQTFVDLSSLDADGNPDASSIRIVGNHAFVALERLTNDVSQQPSQIAVLDATSLALVQTITLKGRNPFGLMVEFAGKLWLADVGSPFDATEPDAGIEVVDTTTLASTLLISEATLGASVFQVAVNATCGAAIVGDPSVANKTSLVSFSLDGSNLATALGPTTGFDLRGLAWLPSGQLLVGDQRSKVGGFPVHVFTAAAPTCALTPGADLTVPDLPAFAFAAL